MLRTYKVDGGRFDEVYRPDSVIWMHASLGEATPWGAFNPGYEIREPFVRAVLNLEVACGIRTQGHADKLLRNY